MPSVNDPNFSMAYGWSLGENGWNSGMDSNLKKIGALFNLSVVSATVGTPPSVTNGARYIIPAGATGAWSGKTNQVAVGVEGIWEYYTPARGWEARVQDDSDKLYSFDGTNWGVETTDTSGFATLTGNNLFSGDNTVSGTLTVPSPLSANHAARLQSITDAVDAINYTNVGGAAGVFKDRVGDDVNFKTIVGGTNVTVDIAADTLTINASLVGTYADLSTSNNFTGANNTFVGVTATSVSTNTLSSNTHEGDLIKPKAGAVTKAIGEALNPFTEAYISAIKGVSTPDGLTSTDGANVDYVDTQVASLGITNVGTGEGVFKQKVGDNFQLKKITAGTDISVTQVGDDIQISFTGTGAGDAMSKAVYDPTEINADAFDRANHTGTQGINTITGLTDGGAGSLFLADDGTYKAAGGSFDPSTAQTITGKWAFDTSTNNYWSAGDTDDVFVTSPTYALSVAEAGTQKFVQATTTEATNSTTSNFSLVSDSSGGTSSCSLGSGVGSIAFLDNGTSSTTTIAGDGISVEGTTAYAVTLKSGTSTILNMKENDGSLGDFISLGTGAGHPALLLNAELDGDEVAKMTINDYGVDLFQDSATSDYTFQFLSQNGTIKLTDDNVNSTIDLTADTVNVNGTNLETTLDSKLPINAQIVIVSGASASHTVVAGDEGKWIVFTGSGTHTLTVNTGLGAGFNFFVSATDATADINYAGTATLRAPDATHTKQAASNASLVSFVSPVADTFFFQGTTEA